MSKTKVKDKPYKLSNGHGLFLYVTPAGGKFWRWQFRFQGKPQLLSIGEYPEMSLTDARTTHQQWQRVLRGGVNPAAEKREERKAEAALAKLNHQRSMLATNAKKAAEKEGGKSEAVQGKDCPSVEEVIWPEGSFGAVQSEWFKKWSDKKSPRYRVQMESRIQTDILSKLGHRHILDIEAPDIANMAKAIDSRGAGELARRTPIRGLSFSLRTCPATKSVPHTTTRNTSMDASG